MIYVSFGKLVLDKCFRGLTFYALSYEQVSIVISLLALEPLFVAFFAYLYLIKPEYISPKLAVSMVRTVFGGHIGHGKL